MRNLIVISLLSLAACGGVTDVERAARIVRPYHVDAADGLVKAGLRDPGSANLSYDYISDNGEIACGRINSWNALWEKRFVVGDGAAYLEGPSINPEFFNGLWNTACR